MVTNRERLNKMSNEELAQVLAELDSTCYFCAYYNKESDILCVCPDKKDCKYGVIEWLNQDSEV